jgi:aminopeptidase N
VVASGQRVRQRTVGATIVSEWRQRMPIPPFVFGFAVGKFAESSSCAGRTPLRFLSAKFTPAELARIFALTAPALRFFKERAGVPFPAPAYTQLLVHGSPMQEVAAFTLLPESYGDDLTAHADDAWLLAHELAHQWWGIAVTCRDWSDFWLNEGMATFLADAFLERQFGAERYAREIEHSRKIYEELKSSGKDRPLSFHGWTKTSEASGRLPYHKGAWVLHQLRQRMGEDAFWNGLRAYTRQFNRRSVTSQNFERAMERSSGQDLRAFFDEWVYR